MGMMVALSGGNQFETSDYKVVCVDANMRGNGDVQGDGGTTLYIARENMNHFVPLRRLLDSRPIQQEGPEEVDDREEEATGLGVWTSTRFVIVVSVFCCWGLIP